MPGLIFGIILAILVGYYSSVGGNVFWPQFFKAILKIIIAGILFAFICWAGLWIVIGILSFLNDIA